MTNQQIADGYLALSDEQKLYWTNVYNRQKCQGSQFRIRNI